MDSVYDGGRGIKTLLTPSILYSFKLIGITIQFFEDGGLKKPQYWFGK
jgi:hypothetical protein